MTPEVIIGILTLLVTCPPSILLLWNLFKRWAMTTSNDHSTLIPYRVLGQRAASLGSVDTYPRPVRTLTNATHHSFNESDIELGLEYTITMVRGYGTY